VSDDVGPVAPPVAPVVVVVGTTQGVGWGLSAAIKFVFPA
jgi:hypothetical protein